MARGRGRTGKGGRKSAAAVQPTDVSQSGQIRPKEEEVDPGAVQGSGNDAKAGSSSKTQNKKGRGSIKSRTHASPLWEKPKLTREDVRCPICWSMLMEPTTLPCNHSMCLTCFEKHIEENSLCCPCCRLRIAVWTRNTTKQGKMLDERLWERLKLEFPALVEARMLGMDTQNIMDVVDSTAVKHEPENDSSETSSPTLLDGVLSVEPGVVKQEYDLLYEQHQRDLELERQREEAASASLIEKIQEEENERLSQERMKIEEEDRKLALKIQQDLEVQEPGSSSRAGPGVLSSSTSINKRNTPRRNLMEEWIANNSFASNSSMSPDICQTPKRRNSNLRTSASKKIGTPSSTATASKTGKRQKSKSQSSRKSDVSSASQELMANFLMSQDSQCLLGNDEADESYDMFETTDVRNEPCCSKSIPMNEMHLSAFSPTKATNRCNIVIGSTTALAVPVSSYSFLENPTSKSPKSKTPSISADESVCHSSTPDSIKSEVDRHFKPIKSAPKTPPRRRPDGTFLPEPKLIKMTPLKAPTPLKVAIRSPGPSRQVSSTSEISSKPSCATAEKRISNDSGRASVSPNEEIALRLRSPNSARGGLVTSDAELGDQNERGCTSDDYRVTPEDTYSKKKKRSFDDKMTSDESPFKKAKPQPTTESDDDVVVPPVVKTELQPFRMELQCSQGLIVIDDDDEEYLQREAEELERLRMRKEQEAADLAFALKLQKDLRAQARRENAEAQGKERYSLRNVNKPGSSSSSRVTRAENKRMAAKRK